MSDLVNIQKEKPEGLCCDSDEPRYPYGTRINLEDELVDQLGIGALAPGDEVQIRAVGFVESKSEYERQSENESHSEKCVGIQLTAIVVNRDSQKDRIKTLYGEGE